MRPRKHFVLPKLDSKFKEKSHPQFLTKSGPNYGKKGDLRPRDQLGLDTLGLDFSVIKFLLKSHENFPR
jgi:hypothetical protein